VNCGVAVDMGATHLRFVLADEFGNIQKKSFAQVQSETGPRGVISQTREGIERLLEGSDDRMVVRGIAVGVPGAVDPKSGKVLDANNLPGWREVDMGQELKQAFGVPIYLDNDANMAAIGERWRGVAQGVDNFVFIAVGTGIGAGIFIDGRMCRGYSGFAGELFRMNLDWTRWEEDFPDTGYLEAYISGVGLAMEGRKVLAGGNGSKAATLAESRDARYVFEAMHAGNPQARALIEKSFVMLGVGVANMVSILDPELVVFNGGIVKGDPELLLETVQKVTRRIHPRAPRIALSTLGDNAQIFGALHTLFEPARQNAIEANATR
jgi:glucokinase